MSLLRNLTLQGRILLVALLPLAIVATALIIDSSRSLKQQGAADINTLRESLVDARKSTLKNLVETAVTAIQPIYENASADDAAAKQRASNILTNIDYGDGNYIYVYTYDGVNVATRPKPELKGKNLWNLQTPSGDYLVRELIADAKEGGGYYRYPWDNPANGREEPKLSYTTGLDKWNWMIGTGVYLSDIDEEVAAAKTRIEAAVHEQIAVNVLMGGGAFLLIAVIAIFMTRKIIGPIRKTSTAMHEIAAGEGDLTQRLPVEQDDEIGELAEQFNAFVATVQQTLREVRGTIDQLASSAEELNQVATATQDTVQRQTGETDHIATAINEMAATVQEISRNGGEAQQAASEADQQARDGGSIVQGSHTSMRELANDITSAGSAVAKLAERSREIETVLDVIHEVTEQTNLLALNAAIEAARAGEQGRGFAVVAEEVRALAKRSSESADRIRTIIEGLVADTEAAVATMDRSRQRSENSLDSAAQAGNALTAIETAVSRIHEQITQIAAAAEQQGQVSEEVNRNITAIVDAAGQSTAGMQQTSQASQELARMSESLRETVNRFRI